MKANFKNLLTLIKQPANDNNDRDIEALVEKIGWRFHFSHHKHINENLTDSELNEIKNYLEEKYNNYSFTRGYTHQYTPALLHAIALKKDNSFRASFFKTPNNQIDSHSSNQSIWDNVPNEIVVQIFLLIKSKKSIDSLSLTNKRFNKIINKLKSDFEQDTRIYVIADIQNAKSDHDLFVSFFQKTRFFYICSSFDEAFNAYMNNWTYFHGCITGYAVFKIPYKFNFDQTIHFQSFRHRDSLEHIKGSNESLSKILIPENLEGFFVINDKRQKPSFFNKYKKYEDGAFISFTNNVDLVKSAQKESSPLDFFKS